MEDKFFTRKLFEYFYFIFALEELYVHWVLIWSE